MQVVHTFDGLCFGYRLQRARVFVEDEGLSRHEPEICALRANLVYGEKVRAEYIVGNARDSDEPLRTGQVDHALMCSRMVNFGSRVSSYYLM